MGLSLGTAGCSGSPLGACIQCALCGLRVNMVSVLQPLMWLLKTSRVKYLQGMERGWQKEGASVGTDPDAWAQAAQEIGRRQAGPRPTVCPAGETCWPVKRQLLDFQRQRTEWARREAHLRATHPTGCLDATRWAPLPPAGVVCASLLAAIGWGLRAGSAVVQHALL